MKYTEEYQKCDICKDAVISNEAGRCAPPFGTVSISMEYDGMHQGMNSDETYKDICEGCHKAIANFIDELEKDK